MNRLPDWTEALDRTGAESVVITLLDRPSLSAVEAELGRGQRTWMADASTETVCWTLDRPGRRIRLAADLTLDDHLERVWVGRGLLE